MRISNFIGVALTLATLVAASNCAAEIPILYNQIEFNCVTLPLAVNHYVDLGEDAAIDEMKAIASDPVRKLRRDLNVAERIGWVCRILFEPQGDAPLRQPSFGWRRLPELTMPNEAWPQYPVV